MVSCQEIPYAEIAARRIAEVPLIREEFVEYSPCGL
jgi:hypothetical protein